MTTNQKRLEQLEKYLNEALKNPADNVKYIQDLVFTIGMVKERIEMEKLTFQMVS